MKYYTWEELDQLVHSKSPYEADALCAYLPAYCYYIGTIEACRTVVEVPQEEEITSTEDPKLLPYIQALYKKIEPLPDYIKEEETSPPPLTIPSSDISLSPSDGPSPVTG